MVGEARTDEDETRIAPVVHAYREIDAPASTHTQIIPCFMLVSTQS